MIAIAVASCGYDDVVTDKVEAVRLSGFDNSGELPKKIEGGTCPRMAYMLWVSFRLSDYADVAHLTQPMTGLRIITVPDFDAEYPAGSDVTHLFKLHPIRPEISMTDFDTNQYESVRFAFPSLQQPLGIVYREGAYFMLMKSPAEERECRFATDVEFSDGKILSAKCQAVTLY